MDFNLGSLKGILMLDVLLILLAAATFGVILFMVKMKNKKSGNAPQKKNKRPRKKR